MQLTSWRKFSLAALMLVMTAVMAACSGGGGGGSDSEATISGAVVFPVADDVVAKQVAASVVDVQVNIQAFTLDGKTAGLPVKPEYDDTVLDPAKRIYSYRITGLTPGVDHVIKVTRGEQVLKKLVEKKDVIAGAGVPQNVDAVSTATVVVASQRLSPTVLFSLGDLPPSGVTVAALSTGIVEMKPSVIENAILMAKDGDSSTLTAETANYANIFNMVVVAVSDTTVGSIDSVLGGTGKINVPFFDTANPRAPAVFTNMSSSNVGSVITQTVDAYTPPKTDAAAEAAVYVQQAKAYLMEQDIANASKSFELALVADDTNAEANLGGAITSGLMMLDDPDFKAILARWEVVYPSVTQVVQGTSPIKLPFGNQSSVTINLSKTAAKAPVAMATTSKVLAAFKALQATMPKQKAGFKSVAKELGLVPVNAPSISEMQTLIDNVIIPRIDKILARLAKIEGQANNGFTITAAMQGNPEFGEDVVLGDGEYYTIDAALNLLQGVLKIVTSYNFDVPSDYTYDTIAQDPLAMINSPSFFTLKSDGVAKMTAALAYAKSATEKAQLAFDTLKLRAAGVGAFDLAGMTDLEKADFQASLTEVKNGLAGASTIGSSENPINVDFTKFFTNPLTRADLPTFGYDVPRDAELSAKYGSAVAAEHSYTNYEGGPINYWTTDCSIEPTSDLPDYALNGILPGNTIANNVAGFNGILPMISGKLLSNTDLSAYNLTTDGTFIYTHDYSGIWKINPADGAVTKVATGSGINYLMWYQGNFYAASNTVQQKDGSWYNAVTISKITIDTATSVYSIDNPLWTSPQAAGYPNFSAFTVKGTDIYYASYTWENDSSVISKLSNLTTNTPLFTTSGWIDSLGVSESFLYINGDKYDLSAPTAALASYEDLYDKVLVGGYFYRVNDGKVVKYAGTPAGGVAKSLGSLF